MLVPKFLYHLDAFSAKPLIDEELDKRLAVLPARLKDELNSLGELLVSGVKNIDDNENLNHHGNWYKYIVENYNDINKENVNQILRDEVGKKFSTVLEHAGVFKRDEEGIKAFNKFINSL